MIDMSCNQHFGGLHWGTKHHLAQLKFRPLQVFYGQRRSNFVLDGELNQLGLPLWMATLCSLGQPKGNGYDSWCFFFQNHLFLCFLFPNTIWHMHTGTWRWRTLFLLLSFVCVFQALSLLLKTAAVEGRFAWSEVKCFNPGLSESQLNVKLNNTLGQVSMFCCTCLLFVWTTVLLGVGILKQNIKWDYLCRVSVLLGEGFFWKFETGDKREHQNPNKFSKINGGDCQRHRSTLPTHFVLCANRQEWIHCRKQDWKIQTWGLTSKGGTSFFSWVLGFWCSIYQPLHCSSLWFLKKRKNRLFQTLFSFYSYVFYSSLDFRIFFFCFTQFEAQYMSEKVRLQHSVGRRPVSRIRASWGSGDTQVRAFRYFTENMHRRFIFVHLKNKPKENIFGQVWPSLKGEFIVKQTKSLIVHAFSAEVLC